MFFVDLQFFFYSVSQLFRRVAAALPGMDSTENKPPEGSILFICHISDWVFVGIW